MKTFAPNPQKVNRSWHLIDAEGKILGKIAVDASKKLMGKNKPEYAPNEILGDKVVIINAEKVAITGNKLRTKVYHHYTGYPGGLRTEQLGSLMRRKPTEVMRKAISGMLPKNKLQKKMLANLYIYKDEKHPHEAQFKENK